MDDGEDENGGWWVDELLLLHGAEGEVAGRAGDAVIDVHEGLFSDYDKDDRVVGVEFLGISMRAIKEELLSFQFQTA